MSVVVVSKDKIYTVDSGEGNWLIHTFKPHENGVLLAVAICCTHREKAFYQMLLNDYSTNVSKLREVINYLYTSDKRMVTIVNLDRRGPILNPFGFYEETPNTEANQNAMILKVDDTIDSEIVQRALDSAWQYHATSDKEFDIGEVLDDLRVSGLIHGRYEVFTVHE